MLIYELFKYIGFSKIIKSNLKIYQRLIKLFKYKNLSDLRKEKLIFIYSKSLFISSIKIITIFTLIIILFLFLNVLSNSYLSLIKSILGIFELSIVFIAYHLIRRKYYDKL